MAPAKSGDTVRIHYTGKLEDGHVFDSSIERDEPFEFTLGSGNVIPGFDKAVTGMDAGEKKTFTIPVAEAYGERNAEMVFEFPKTELPGEVDPEAGMVLEAQGEDGGQYRLTVTEVNEDTVTLDGNHPLAGKDLTFEIELLEIAE
ncbi:FKBP-type peptidyl-prolyl cis-trans isomerase [Desulfovibrio ferrophilus]|uniref:Peptidyl-prolyl cis-trans isomerase n=1 Tax=Desulfovibrio ferrophilus TaxID=241368 RepID=A0A2Z6AZU3_9BACT|nr:peptidylprolyl isomerase [Desulfovibrio ferrophilus]BBD08738.1 FKBP-type peptidyl-prolyl cis-trans isomerase [Desulfovibrio ferrophilus]